MNNSRETKACSQVGKAKPMQGIGRSGQRRICEVELVVDRLAQLLCDAAGTGNRTPESLLADLTDTDLLLLFTGLAEEVRRASSTASAPAPHVITYGHCTRNSPD